MLDRASRKVAVEILEASLTDLAPPDPGFGLDDLLRGYVNCGAALADLEIGVFARGLEAMGEPGGRELRQQAAADTHRYAARLSALAVGQAAAAMRLGGKESPEALGAASWELRSSVAEESLPGNSPAELLANAQVNFIRAAGNLVPILEGADEFESYADMLLEVAAFALFAAASYRAHEPEVNRG